MLFAGGMIDNDHIPPPEKEEKKKNLGSLHLPDQFTCPIPDHLKNVKIVQNHRRDASVT